MADQVLDGKGLKCPLPILKAKRALNVMAQEGSLEIPCHRSPLGEGFQAFCRSTGNQLL